MSTPTPNESILISPRPKAVADKSWWLEQPSREGFTKRAEGELPRMALSKFCRQQWDKATEGTDA